MSWITRERGELPDGFEEATWRAFVAPPPAETERRHLVAIAAAVEETKRAPAPGARRLSRSRTLARLAATGAAAALALPVALAGLAFAGVSLPDAADSAFETVGIELPNQTPDADEADGSPAAEGGQRSGAQGKDQSGDAASGKGGNSNQRGADQGTGGDGKREADASGPPEHANGPPAHAADGSTGAPQHSQQGGGGPPDHAADGSTGPPPHAQGNANGQSTAPAPDSSGSSGGDPASGNPHGAPPTAGPKNPKQGVGLPEALP